MTTILLYALGIALIVNLIFFVIAYIKQTDKLTDMTYSLTFVMIAITGLIQSKMSLPQYFMAGMIILWAIRLGSFLMRRVHAIGRDDRFDNIRPYALKFMGFWTMQAITCFIVSLPALIVYSGGSSSLDLVFVIGILVSVAGLLIETMADNQKYRFKSKHPDQFMKSGLWRRIRHPNYTGEIMFWLGLGVAAFSSPLGYLALISPVWISFILLRFSGIPLLQEKWEKRYGDQSDFQTYKENSWLLVPYVY